MPAGLGGDVAPPAEWKKIMEILSSANLFIETQNACPHNKQHGDIDSDSERRRTRAGSSTCLDLP